MLIHSRRSYILSFVVLTTVLAAQKAGVEDKWRKPLLGVVHTQAPRGVRIVKVMQNSAAERAGLQVGDIILTVGGVAIRNPKHLFSEVQRYRAGSVVAIEYERAGSINLVQVALGERLDSESLIGQKAPEFTLPQFGVATPYTLSPGKVFIIDFWATWCAPCEPVREALEDFKRTNRRLDIVIVGITSEDEDTVRSFLRKKGAEYPILIDAKGTVAIDYAVAGYPTLVVIDKKGFVRFAGFAAGGGLEQALFMAETLAKK